LEDSILAWVKRSKQVAAGVCALVALVSAPARAEIIDGVVGAVEGSGIPLSILRAYQDAYDPEQPMGVALQQFIDERLLSGQARRYGQVVPAAELTGERRAKPMPAGLTKPEWDQVLSDHLLAAQFLKFRFGDFVPVSREQEQAYFDANRASFPGSFAESVKRIHDILLPLVRAQREQAYRNDLRQRVDVRMDATLLDAAAHAR
jgi:hypothetical protein